MTLRKRLRVLWAALRQNWHQHACLDCPETWCCQGVTCKSGQPLMTRCATCEATQHEQWFQAQMRSTRRLGKGVVA